MIFVRQLERGMGYKVKARIQLPSAHLNVKLCYTGTYLLDHSSGKAEPVALVLS